MDSLLTLQYMECWILLIGAVGFPGMRLMPGGELLSRIEKLETWGKQFKHTKNE